MLAEPEIMQQQKEMVSEGLLDDFEDALVEFQHTLSGIFDGDQRP
jgi:hypothetical protein